MNLPDQRTAPASSNYPRVIHPSQPVTYSYHRLPGGAILPVTAADMAPMTGEMTLLQPPSTPTPARTEPLPNETQQIPTFAQINVPGEQRIETLADYGIEVTPPSPQRL